ncbi:MAG: hypothetical protein FJ316_00645 [SAR202 cluster bacterium]|nr:hypothetical protein [SAR202 cluster bacterium]
MVTLQLSKFAVDELPFCVWDPDLHERNLDFINSIDPAYFAYLADVHLQGLEKEETKQHAALSLQTAYSHGLKTFVALVFATIQAPDCLVGWLNKYDIGDLRSLVQKVANQQSILSKLRVKPITWEAIANIVLTGLSLEDKDKERAIKRNFAVAWSHFAHDFVDQRCTEEYNSIKHGLRVRSGGFYLAIGRENTPGVSSPQERMQPLANSDFGSSFPVLERLAGTKLDFCIGSQSRNWHPEDFFYGLHLLSLSLQNVLSFLKVVIGGDPATVEFSWPSDETDFQRPWKRVALASAFAMKSSFTLERQFQSTKEDILSAYNPEAESRST